MLAAQKTLGAPMTPNFTVAWLLQWTAQEARQPSRNDVNADTGCGRSCVSNALVLKLPTRAMHSGQHFTAGLQQRTPLAIAQQFGHAEVAHLLAAAGAV